MFMRVRPACSLIDAVLLRRSRSCQFLDNASSLAKLLVVLSCIFSSTIRPNNFHPEAIRDDDVFGESNQSVSSFALVLDEVDHVHASEFAGELPHIAVATLGDGLDRSKKIGAHVDMAELRCCW